MTLIVWVPLVPRRRTEFSGSDLSDLWFAVWREHGAIVAFHCSSSPVPSYERACVSLLSLIWKQLIPLSCSTGCNPNQTKAPPFQATNQNWPIFSIFPLQPALKFCMSFCFFFFLFIFALLSYHSSHFSKLLENITLPLHFSLFSFLKPVYIRLICLWQKDAPLLLRMSQRNALKNVWKGLR